MTIARNSLPTSRTTSILLLSLLGTQSFPIFRRSCSAFANHHTKRTNSHTLSRMSSSSSISPSVTADQSTGGTWNDDVINRRRAMSRCIVPLTPTSHKGSSGRVGVLGGSARYTGAPYYASMSALKAGADLAYCFCAHEAAIPLKCYSPELMVAPVYRAAELDEMVRTDQTESEEAERLVMDMVEQVCDMMDKMHSLVVGPGLGRCPLVLEATARIIQQAQSKYKLPLVMDADALFLLSLSKYSTLLTNDSLVVLTPNVMERKRLMESSVILPESCVVIEKGAQDRIVRWGGRNSDDDTNVVSLVCREEGGLKRSGGIGDILAGTCGTLVAWNRILTGGGTASADDLPLACWAACCFVKQSTRVAYEKHKRCMTAPDILQELGPTIDAMTSYDM